MARVLRLPALRLLAAAMAVASVLACWSLSQRLEQAAVLIAGSDDLARAAESAAAALEDSVARAGFAAQGLSSGCCVQLPAAKSLAEGAEGVAGLAATGPGAAASETGAAEMTPSRVVRGGALPIPGPVDGLGDRWRAEAEATRQLDALHGLSLRPGLEWLARPLVDLRDASLAQMAAADDALRRPGTRKDGIGLAEPGTPSKDRVSVLAGQVRREADDHRRDVVAALLARAARDKERLMVAVTGTALLFALLLVAAGAGSAAPTRRGRSIASIQEPAVSGSGLAEPPRPAAMSTALPQSDATKPTLRILLVEDNAMVRFSLEMMLSDLGHTVSAAATAAEALRLAEADPEVLVTDLGLPDLDGVALACRLRVLYPRLRVVIASGRSGSAPGMVWLQKPFDLDRLRRAVEASERLDAQGDSVLTRFAWKGLVSATGDDSD